MNVLAILLAAGFSRRFGAADKLLQPLPDGRVMAVAAAHNLLQALPRVVAVVREENEAIKAQLELAGVRVLTCQEHQREMADSMAAAVGYGSRIWTALSSRSATCLTSGPPRLPR